jgi:hypothetical protein
MTGKPLSSQQIAALWRAYKIRQTVSFVAKHCDVSWGTAEKYIRDHNFAQRFVKLQAKANEFLDEDQAKSLARDLKNITNIKSFIADALLDALKNKTFKPGTANYDRILRLERYLRGEPESHSCTSSSSLNSSIPFIPPLNSSTESIFITT